MVIWNAEKQEAIALDYRERAPAKAHRRMYIDAAGAGDPSSLSRRGALAIAVPGTVAGLCYALEKYGTLDLRTVMQPAIRLAREGVAIDDHTRRVQSLVLKQFAEHPAYRQKFRTLYEQYLNRGATWEPGERFRSPQAQVLEMISEQGAEAFYAGAVGESILEEVDSGDGVLERADLEGMTPTVRNPLRGQFAGFDIDVDRFDLVVAVDRSGPVVVDGQGHAVETA